MVESSRNKSTQVVLKPLRYGPFTDELKKALAAFLQILEDAEPEADQPSRFERSDSDIRRAS
jgi:hypothetical protein